MMTSASDFGASFKKFMDQMASAAPAAEPVFRRRFAEHLGVPPMELPVVHERFAQFEHPNLQLAIEAILGAPETEHQTLGVVAQHHGYMGIHLTDLMADCGPWRGAEPAIGPVEYTNLALADDRLLACIRSGIVLLKRAGVPLICLVHSGSRMERGAINVEVIAPRREEAERFLADLRRLMRQRNAYRGHILSLSSEYETGLQVHFHHLPTVTRDRIILPTQVLQRIERQTLGFSRHAAKLAAAKRHLKRGVLLHGPPGTGKTLTAMYLANEMKGRTVLLVTGRGQGMIEQACWMARVLEPSTIILEDVDLIAREREDDRCSTPLLFELLNQMDGLAEDADILFLLTTNRPDLLEPALAARPGRIDEAILVPLPDAECRARLLDLYAAGLDLRLKDRERLIARTQGASAAFMRELLRKAAVFACDDGAGLVVEDRHLDEALHDLVVTGGTLTRRLLGFESGTEDGQGQMRP